MANSCDTRHYKYYSNCDSSKTFILVKLTDSALKTIENHLSSNYSALPSISFKSDTNSGVLSFPLPTNNHSDVNNENAGGERRFNFNLSNVDAGGPQGSFECLFQKDYQILESRGNIRYKMQIHASEDSYERTKERMAESQNESKKYCTKFIKGIGGSKVGKRAVVKKSTDGCSPELMKKSLRERIIHLLALRPFKKPELLARLNKEGIKEKDRKNLSQVLNQISKLKENAYNLAAHAWNEVQVDDWPFYSPEQREIVRARNPLTAQQRPTSGKIGLSPLTCQDSPSPPGLLTSTSSSLTNNNSRLLSTTSKRTADIELNNKRQRLNANSKSSSKRGPSPNVASNNNNSNSNNTSNNNNNSSNSKTDFQNLMSEWSMKPRSPEPNYYNNNTNHHHHGVANSLSVQVGSTANGSTCSTPNSSPDSGTGSNDGNLSTISSKSMFSINSELPDYAIKYVEITNDEQLKRYKEDFNLGYKEYRRLHRNIDLIAQKFSAYEVKLKSTPEGSEEWNRILEEIFAEYEAVKKNYKYMETKRRVAYLHEKLSLIKRLIQEYKGLRSSSSSHHV